MTTHNPHNAAHDVATERHEEKERPKKTLNASHARCTMAIRRETITNKKSGHLKTNLPEVEALVELWRRRRGRPEVLAELWRRHRGRQRTWSIEADGTRDWSTDKSWTANKDRTSDWRETSTANKDRTSDWRKTSTARRRKKKKVSNPRNPTPCLSPAVNLVCVLVDYRVVNIGSKTKYRLSIDSEREMLRERCVILSIRTTCNVRNPKACNVGLLIFTEKKIINVIGRESRGVRRRCAWREVRCRCAWTEPEYE